MGSLVATNRSSYLFKIRMGLTCEIESSEGVAITLKCLKYVSRSTCLQSKYDQATDICGGQRRECSRSVLGLRSARESIDEIYI
jgi:hypothetical protein